MDKIENIIERQIPTEVQDRREELNILEEKAKECRECILCNNRNKSVFSKGDCFPKFMIIGMGAGANENKQGKPFVGRAGKLLDKMLLSININPEDVYITNCVKCFLPDNKITQEQFDKCSKQFLLEEIKLIKPKYIILLGNTVVDYMFDVFSVKRQGNLMEIKGKEHKSWIINDLIMGTVKEGVSLIPEWHPAGILRQPSMLETYKDDWKDLVNIFKPI